MKMYNIIKYLREISALFKKYNVYLYEDIEVLIGLERIDKNKFIEELTGRTMWGGAGAICEVVLYDSDGEKKQDDKRFRDLIVKIGTELKKNNITNSRIDFIVQVLKEWKQKGI